MTLVFFIVLLLIVLVSMAVFRSPAVALTMDSAFSIFSSISETTTFFASKFLDTGKSTLAKLLIHYYDPQKGSISIGGQKLCDMSLEALNSHISYVAQDQYLFNTSLLENIRLGRLNATDEEVMEAAKKAQCMEFLEKLPQGIHSMAGDAGKMLSGGQRQRISLARAILKGE